LRLKATTVKSKMLTFVLPTKKRLVVSFCHFLNISAITANKKKRNY